MSLNLSDASFNFVNPATQTPLFIAEWVTCAYPVSDLYASSARYLYYTLLVLVIATQWYTWLANVFLGVVAAYAGVAAIEAFILAANPAGMPDPTTVTIPYIDRASVPGNATLSQIPNLITNFREIVVQPAALEYDIDAVLAVVVVGYLFMLPVHCWSSSVRTNRARQLLILLWNAVMLGGMICAIIIWPSLFEGPLQYRFCYPTNLDSDSVTSDGSYDSDLWKGDWNSTIWATFSNFTTANSINNNCLYPCFNTTQILRRQNTLVADVGSRSARTSAQLLLANVAPAITNLTKETFLASLMYAALGVTTITMGLMLVFVLTPIRKLIRVPIHRPAELLWSARKELFHALWEDFACGCINIFFLFRHPLQAYNTMRSTPTRVMHRKAKKLLRFWLDMLALLMLFIAMVLTPATTIVFIVWIEWYLKRDLVSSEAPQQVGQWSSSVSVALVLVSAALLKLKYPLATETELVHEIGQTHEHLERLERILKEKREKNAKKQRPSQENGVEMRQGLGKRLMSDVP